jgi:chorismate dehydratase
MSASTLRLGHITYSNCFPVHARLIAEPRRGDPVLVEGTPADLNSQLARGAIHVAPCSSIEFALHANRYRILPELVIGSRGPVQSIRLLSDRPPEELGGRRVAIPSASATSVVLLKILLRRRWRVPADFFWFDQAGEDPFARGADAALYIGDVALRPDLHSKRDIRLDLGAEWWRETGLPFAFALWQVGGGSVQALRQLHELLLESRDYGRESRLPLAERYARHFGLAPAALAAYWEELAYELDEQMIEGLLTFYRFAAELGEIPAVPELRWIS